MRGLRAATAPGGGGSARGIDWTRRPRADLSGPGRQQLPRDGGALGQVIRDDCAREGREGDHASVLLAGNDLLLLTSDAALVVAEPNAEAFAVARQYEVANGATWSMPVPLPDGLLVRDATSLVRLVPADGELAPRNSTK